MTWDDFESAAQKISEACNAQAVDQKVDAIRSRLRGIEDNHPSISQDSIAERKALEGDIGELKNMANRRIPQEQVKTLVDQWLEKAARSIGGSGDSYYL